MFEVGKTYWKEAFSYRAQYYFTLFLNPLRFFVLIFVWGAVYSQNDIGQIQGYSFNDLITYFILTNISFTLIYNQITENMEEYIRKGDFIIYMLKPWSYLKLSFVMSVSKRIFALFAEIIPLMLIVSLFFKENFVFGHIFFYLISMGFAFFIYYCIELTVGGLAFWMTSIRSFSWLLYFIMSVFAGLYVPITFFPETLVRILDFLPFKYIIFIPINIYLGTIPLDLSQGFIGSVWYYYLIQFFWCLILFIIAKLFWKISLKRFSGVGA